MKDFLLPNFMPHAGHLVESLSRIQPLEFPGGNLEKIGLPLALAALCLIGIYHLNRDRKPKSPRR